MLPSSPVVSWKEAEAVALVTDWKKAPVILLLLKVIISTWVMAGTLSVGDDDDVAGGGVRDEIGVRHFAGAILW